MNFFWSSFLQVALSSLCTAVRVITAYTDEFVTFCGFLLFFLLSANPKLMMNVSGMSAEWFGLKVDKVLDGTVSLTL